MIVLSFKDGTFEILSTDKLELKVETLLKNEVDSIFVAKNKSDINAFIQVNS